MCPESHRPKLPGHLRIEAFDGEGKTLWVAYELLGADADQTMSAKEEVVAELLLSDGDGRAAKGGNS